LELEDAAFGLKQGEVSSLLRTIHGFHILKAGERKPGEIKSFDEMKDKLRKDLEKKRFEGKKQALIENLKKEYPVEIYLEQGNG
jgi:parvulin-like peptidyl-prolyl isomerase